MDTIELCNKIESGEQVDDACETLASRYRDLHEAAKLAEIVMSQLIDQRQDVSESHPWSILEKLRGELKR